MDKNKELDLDDVKKSLEEMGIPYREGPIPEHLISLIKSFGYEGFPLLADLTNVDTADAELGVIVRNIDQSVDNGIYIFTVLHSGQAGFIVVAPGTISRAPLVRKVSGDLTAAITAVDMPPLTPFDMVGITAHTLANTFMKNIMESCQVPDEFEQAFLRLYMPKFLANVGMYFVGAVKDDGTPMVYEEIANMEPMIVWRSIQKGDAAGHESSSAEDTRNEEKEEAPLP